MGADAIGVPGDKSAGQWQVCSYDRSCWQRIALTLRTIGVFPMTFHLECVAHLVKG